MNFANEHISIIFSVRLLLQRRSSVTHSRRWFGLLRIRTMSSLHINTHIINALIAVSSIYFRLAEFVSSDSRIQKQFRQSRHVCASQSMRIAQHSHSSFVLLTHNHNRCMVAVYFQRTTPLYHTGPRMGKYVLPIHYYYYSILYNSLHPSRE